jgi:23S rRNA pseudouridine2604 synthase
MTERNTLKLKPLVKKASPRPPPGPSPSPRPVSTPTRSPASPARASNGPPPPRWPGPVAASNKKPRLRKPRFGEVDYVAPPSQAGRSDEGERLSKRVMQLKGCSRKEAEQYIAGGWVRVDGVVQEEPHMRVAEQTVAVDAHANLMAVTDVTLILHKPAGYSDGLEDPDDEEDEDEAPARRPAPRGRNAALPNARNLLTATRHWSEDTSSTRLLKRHFQHLEADVELENGASGLVVFTQDWRTTRKLTEDMGTMEHEMLVEVQGEVEPEALKPIGYALKDDRLALPQVKVSVSSSTPAMSRLRFAIKGSHPGLVAYLCGLAGLTIVGMRRVRLGRVALADLPVGQWRYLAEGERF